MALPSAPEATQAVINFIGKAGPSCDAGTTPHMTRAARRGVAHIFKCGGAAAGAGEAGPGGEEGSAAGGDAAAMAGWSGCVAVVADGRCCCC